MMIIIEGKYSLMLKEINIDIALLFFLLLSDNGWQIKNEPNFAMLYLL
jgi:hypothetical protein